jgi:hypothetical protein
MLQTAKKIVSRKRPARSKAPRQALDAQDSFIKHDRIANPLEDIARKADLVAWALQGVMALEDNDVVWPIQDAAHEIKDAIEAIAREVRS